MDLDPSAYSSFHFTRICVPGRCLLTSHKRSPRLQETTRERLNFFVRVRTCNVTVIVSFYAFNSHESVTCSYDHFAALIRTQYNRSEIMVL